MLLNKQQPRQPGISQHGRRTGDLQIKHRLYLWPLRWDLHRRRGAPVILVWASKIEEGRSAFLSLPPRALWNRWIQRCPNHCHSQISLTKILGPVVQKVSSGFGNPTFSYPGSGNPSYFCAGFGYRKPVPYFQEPGIR